MASAETLPSLPLPLLRLGFLDRQESIGDVGVFGWHEGLTAKVLCIFATYDPIEIENRRWDALAAEMSIGKQATFACDQLPGRRHHDRMQQADVGDVLCEGFYVPHFAPMSGADLDVGDWE
jgi:hypothetical protein